MGFREADHPVGPDNCLSPYKSLKHEKTNIYILFLSERVRNVNQIVHKDVGANRGPLRRRKGV
jgi:hypothetical protein